jgi:hypothetical protein
MIESVEPALNELLLLFSSYFLACSSSGRQLTHVNLRDPDILLLGDKQTKTIPIFTDKAGVEEFVEKLKLKHPIFGKLQSREELIEFLKDLKRSERFGYERVTLDPRAEITGSQMRTYTIDKLLRALEGAWNQMGGIFVCETRLVSVTNNRRGRA